MMRRRSRITTHQTGIAHAEAIARAARAAAPPPPDDAAVAARAANFARGTLPGGLVPEGVTLALPKGFVVVDCAVSGTDRHGAGKYAALQALGLIAPDASLEYEGTRPIVVRGSGHESRGPSTHGHESRGPVAISITHSLTRAFAVAARVERIGIDIVDDVDDPRFERMAPRYLHREVSFAHTPRDIAKCFAAKEAGLKALGLGLLDGGMFDNCAVNVLSLDPPRLASTSHSLRLVFGRTDTSTLAIAFA